MYRNNNKAQVKSASLYDDPGTVENTNPLSLQAEFRVQKEAVWAVANFATGASQSQLSMLVHSGVLEPLLNLLTAPDMKIIIIILDIVSYFLQVSCSERQS